MTPIRLYPLYCTLYLCTLTRRQIQAQVALSLAFVSDFCCCKFYSVHFIGYNLASAFRLRFLLEIYKLLFCSFCWKLAVATTALNFEHVRRPYICVLLSVFFAQFFFHPELTSAQHTFAYQVFNPLRLLYFVRFLSRPTEHFSVKNPKLPLLLCYPFALQWLPSLFLLGTTSHPFGFHLLFPFLPTCHRTEPHNWFHITGPVRSGGDQISKTEMCQCSSQPAYASPSGPRQTRCLQRFG